MGAYKETNQSLAKQKTPMCSIYVMLTTKTLKPTNVVILVLKPKALNQYKCGMQNECDTAKTAYKVNHKTTWHIFKKILLSGFISCILYKLNI